jgi:hypothetical protein
MDRFNRNRAIRLYSIHAVLATVRGLNALANESVYLGDFNLGNAIVTTPIIPDVYTVRLVDFFQSLVTQAGSGRYW